jgi:DnaJ like chaperone protein
MAYWNGKLTGGVLGAVLGGPVGAALGALAGHRYDEHEAANDPANVARVQQLFFPSTFRLMGHIAKADGRVSEQEIAAAMALMRALQLGPRETAAAMEYYSAGKQADFSFSAALGGLRSAMVGQPRLVQFFVELQLQVTIAGDALAGLSRQRLCAAAAFLGMPVRYYKQLEARMRSRATAGPTLAMADAQAYAVLEVESAISDEQLTRAYRRLMSRHHPDKLMANGLPESMLERAKERTQQIQAAYEQIKRARGMS